MNHRATTSRVGGTERRARPPDSGIASRAPLLPPGESEAQLQAWEDEGGAGASSVATRILVVDNDMMSADSLELLLHASGNWETRVAYTADAALAIAGEFSPAVVLLDLNLVDMTSYELAQALRERAQSRGMRLIALTTSREHAAREQARVGGFERYLLKPVDPLVLSEVIDSPRT